MRATSLSGRVLDQRYQLETRIGGGGMGEVYRGRHLMMDQRVAVKILRPELAHDRDAARRFAREARSTFRLDHPNCVRVTDFGATDDGLLYLVMEYLDGRTVARELDCDGPMHAARVVHIGSQVCAALACAHQSGLIHRDLKPDNVMLVHRGADPDVVKVLDFGLAKIITDPRAGLTTAMSLTPLTREGVIFGTPAYMSPEQAVDDPLTPASDLYTLGVVLYEMLTGAAPFESPSHMEVLAAHVNQRPVPPRARRPDLDIAPALDALVMRLLGKQPAERPGSAATVAAELERLLEQRAAAGLSGPRPRVSTTVAASSTVDMDSDEIARTAGAPGVRPGASVDTVPRGPVSEARMRPRARRPGWWLAGLGLAVSGLVITLMLASGSSARAPQSRAAPGSAIPDARSHDTGPAAAGQGSEPPVHPSQPARAKDASVARTIEPDAVPVGVGQGTQRSGKTRANRSLSEAQMRALDEHLERAESARVAGNVLSQMAHADSALELAPDHARAAYLLGDALLASDRERACRYLKKARRKLAEARESYTRAGCGRAD